MFDQDNDYTNISMLIFAFVSVFFIVSCLLV